MNVLNTTIVHVQMAKTISIMYILQKIKHDAHSIMGELWEHLRLVKVSSHKSPNTVLFHLHQVSRIDKQPNLQKQKIDEWLWVIRSEEGLLRGPGFLFLI